MGMGSKQRLRCDMMTYLKVEEETITPTPGLALADDDGRHRCTYAK